MGDFGDAERRILAFMTEGTEFVFQDKKYKVIFSGKPTCHKGEPKTDIYILAKGKVEEGYDADLCILDQELQLVEVIAKGNTVYKK